MPFASQNQAKAMFAAKEGNSTLGIPQKVGAEFVKDSQGQPTSPLPEYMDAQNGHKAKRKKTHRGNRKPKAPQALQAEAQTHIQNAAKAPTPSASLGHLFKAVRSMHAANQASTPPASGTDQPGTSTGGY